MRCLFAAENTSGIKSNKFMGKKEETPRMDYVFASSR